MAIYQKILTSDKIRDKKTKRLIKSSQERYRDVATGKIITRRQRDKLIKAIPKEVRKKDRAKYVLLRDSFIAKQKQKGKVLSKREAGLSPTLNSIIKDLKRGAKLKNEGKIEEANEVLLKALKKTTRRDGINDTIPVGESNTQREA